MNILHQGNINTLYGDFLAIHWDPTKLCNYRCSYCGNSAKQPSKSDWLDLDNAKRMFDNLLKTNRSRYLINLAGGEPTFYPHIIPILQHIGRAFNNKLNYLSIITNGSRDVNFYETIASLSDSIPILLTVSIHLERADLNHIKMILDTISSNTSLCFNLMFNPALREKSYLFFNQMLEWRKDYPFGMSTSLLRELKNGNIIDRRYSSDDISWQAQATKDFCKIHESSSKKYISRGIMDTSVTCSIIREGKYSYERIWDMNEQLKRGVCNLANKYCVQGTSLIYIGPDGYAYNAICSTVSRSIKPLYNSLPFEGENFCRVIKCPEPVCGCGANNNLQKFDSFEEANAFLTSFRANHKKRENDLAIINGLEKQIVTFTRIFAALKPEHLPVGDFIDQDYYFAEYPDVAQSGMSAQEHWVKYGWKERRNPAPWFDTPWYLSQFEDSERPRTDPLAHYVLKGCLAGKLPAPETGDEAKVAQ